MTATQTMTEDKMFTVPENPAEDTSFTIPDFATMKVVDLKEFVVTTFSSEAETTAALKMKKDELIAHLKAMFPHPDALDTPEVTGFDPGDPIHATVAEAQALTSESAAISKIYGLVDANDFNFFKMGGFLAEMLAKGWMGEYDDFGSMVEGEFGFKNRKALYLISIYHAIVSCGASWDEVKGIGWSKLGIIATSLTPDNYKDWFELVSETNFASTRELVKQKNETTGAPPPADQTAESTPKKTLKFVVHEDQLENIQAALAKAKEAGNTEFDGPALDWICIDYLAGGSGAAIAQAVPTVDEAPAVHADSTPTGTPEERLTAFIQTMIEGADEPMDSLVVAVNAFETAFGTVYPDIDFDVYTDGKPDEDELADDDA